MAVNYLTRDHLMGFDRYKYSAIDTNPISLYILHPFWNAVVKICPKWLAPNVLTFVGFLLTLINFLVLSYYDYYFYASSLQMPENPPIPHWVWMFCAINHFLAHTLDGIDGKQARRTNSSGPLGELFDHGLDSWTTLFIPCCLYAVFGRADYSITAFDFYLCLWNVHLTFLSSHWEKYNTGILYLPWGYDASQICCFVVYLITFFCGFTFWKFTIPILNIPTGICLKIFLYVGSIGLSLPISLYNIYKSYRDKTGKMHSLYEGTRPLISSFIFMAMCLIWVCLSPNDIINKDPRCVYLLTGTILSNICCRLIVSQMTNTRCEVWNWLLVAVAVAMGLVLGVPSLSIAEFTILRLLIAFVVMAHLHYGICVVRQLCDHFGIFCFTLKKVNAD